MGTNGDGESQEDGRPQSPYSVLQHLSEVAFRVAGEALHSVYSGTGPGFQSMQQHRRRQSEIFTSGPGNLRSTSFPKLKNQMQKAWRWGGNSREQGYLPSFNPEVLARNASGISLILKLCHTKYKEPTLLFEHFIVVGLHPDSNPKAVEDAFARKKKRELDMEKSDLLDFNSLQRAPSFPTLVPQILFRYPPGKRLAVRLKDLAAFCFPGGVKTRLLERTPSLSELNELVYGQVGTQHKPADLKIKTSNLVHVNVLKNQVKMCHLPALPRYKELVSELRLFHNRLSLERPALRHPVYRCNEVQVVADCICQFLAEAATQFLTRPYLESLCSDLRSNTITSVQSNNDRASLLLKDSFIAPLPLGTDHLSSISSTHNCLPCYQTLVCRALSDDGLGYCCY